MSRDRGLSPDQNCGTWTENQSESSIAILVPATNQKIVGALGQHATVAVHVSRRDSAEPFASRLYTSHKRVQYTCCYLTSLGTFESQGFAWHEPGSSQLRCLWAAEMMVKALKELVPPPPATSFRLSLQHQNSMNIAADSSIARRAVIANSQGDKQDSLSSTFLDRHGHITSSKKDAHTGT